MKADLKKVWETTGRRRVNGFAEFRKQVDAFVVPRRGERNRFLFRGGADAKYTLLPSLAREMREKSWIKVPLLYHIEKEATDQFARKAHLYLDGVFLPEAQNDPFRWWQLMQHHGAKTRLLDWTASPYVAAYFAVVDKPDRDGVVWMLDQGAHSDRMKERFPAQFKSSVRNIPLEPRTRRDHALLSSSVIFFPCTQPNERMAAQQGWFSCASLADADHEEAIAEAFLDFRMRRWAKKIIIAARAKQAFLRELWTMNITGETLFPGLDGLGRAMAELPHLLRPERGWSYLLESGLLSTSSRAFSGRR
jgi:uncharacterized glyoxalase superfamily protein PhnB